MTRLSWPAALVAAACSAESGMSDGINEADDGATTDASVSLRLDVVPGSIREEGDDSAFRALPQTFRPLGMSTSDLSVGTLELFTPQAQSGTVVGYLTNPQIAVLPGTVQAVDATVWMRAPDTVQSVFTRTGTAGAFEVWVVPRSDYRLEIIPDDPLFPVWSMDLPVGAVTVEQNIDLGTGVPVYGVVSSSSGPVVGAQVYAVDELGLTSTAARTDNYGIYQVRVTPGNWTIVCAGRDFGQDPTITISAVEVGDLGANVDVTYPTTLGTTVTVEGRLISNDGAEVQGTTVRFTAESLEGFQSVGVADGHAGATAAWMTETLVNNDSTIFRRVVPGTYTIEVLPPTVDSGPDFSPERITGVELVADVTQLGTLEVTPIVSVTGVVRTETSATIADAVVTCVEAEFDQRFWTTTAGADGVYAIDLPEVLVHCDVAPPAGSTLASTRVSFDPGTGVRAMDFTVPAGVRVTGTVTVDGAVEPFAVVNVYDESGRLLGFGLTGESGVFEIPIDLD